MGMFDYVVVTCPHCGRQIEDQTKDFNCIMDTIDLDKELPSSIAMIFAGEWTCDHCGKLFLLDCEIPKKIILEKTKL